MTRERLGVGLLFLGFALASTMGADWSPWVEAFLGILAVLNIVLAREALAEHNWRSPLLWLWVLMVVMLAVLPFSGDKYASMRTIIYWFIGFSFFLSGQTWGREVRQTLLFWFVAVAGLGGLWAIIHFSFFSELDRASGFLSNANALGGFAVLFFPVALGCGISFRGWRRWVSFGAAAALLGALVLSFSLTGIFCLLVVGVVWLLLQPKQRIFQVLTWSFSTLAGVAILSVGFRFVQTRNFAAAVRLDQVITSAHFSSSFTQRAEFIRVSGAMLLDKPLTGIGPGAFQLAFSQYGQTRLEQPRYAHNAYLEVFAEGGIVAGLVCLTIFYFLIRGIRASVRERGADWPLVMGSVIGLSVTMVHSITDFAWHFPGVWVGMWVIAGLVVQPFMGRQIRIIGPVLKGTVVLFCLCIIIRGSTVALGYPAMNRGDAALATENFPVVIEAYRSGLQWDPNPAIMAQLANALWLVRPEGNASFQEAEILADQAKQWAPKNYAAYRALARVAVAKKQDDRAEEKYRQAVTLDRHFHPELTAEFMNFLRARGKADQALRLQAEAEDAYRDILEPGQKLFQ